MATRILSVIMILISVISFSQKESKNSNFSKAYDAYSFSANNSQIWTPNSNPFGNQSTVKIEHELRIVAGTNITIKDMTFQFGPEAKVIIEKGTTELYPASLILNNTKFTLLSTLGEELWEGMKVEGVNQQENKSAFVELYNNSVIEHSRCGINVEPSGKVVVNNSSFINNHIGINFNQNELTNESLLYKTKFTWDDELKKETESKTLIHISMNNTRSVMIKNSNFLNETKSNLKKHFDSGIGLQAVNSSFTAIPDCNDLGDISCQTERKNIFKNLEFGVYVINYNKRGFRVDFSDMSNCKTGIFTRYAQNEKINRNKIAIREYGIEQKYGIVVENSSGYMVEENYLTHYDSPLITNAAAKTFGVVIRESGDEHNEIYKNSFDNLFVGSQAEGVNGAIGNENDPFNNGFQWKCNKFTHNIYKNDIVIANGMVDHYQGFVESGTNYERAIKTARNRFSLAGESFRKQHDIRMINSQNDMLYVHLSDANQTPDSYTYTISNIVAPLEQSTELYYDESYCPSSFEINGPVGKNELELINNRILLLKEELNKDNNKIMQNGNDEDNITNINLINELTNDNNPRLYLQHELMYEQAQYETLKNKYLSDLEIDKSKKDLFVNELEESEFLSHRKKTFEIFLENNDNENIQKQLIWLKNNGVSNDYVQLAFLRKKLNQYLSLNEAFKTDTILANSIMSIASSSEDKESKLMAQSIIDLANERYFVIPYVEEENDNLYDYLPENSNFNKQNKTKIYPNPNNGYFTVEINTNLENFIIEIVDLRGRTVYENTFNSNKDIQINTNKLFDGLYLLNVKQNNVLFDTQKIEIKN